MTVNPVYDSIVNQVEFSAHDNNADAHAALASTINALLAPSKDTDTVRNLLSYLANRYTKAAGVDDWKTDPATTLAALNAFVSNCASGSDVTWSGKKFTNSRLGITGLMDSNGYVSFGPNFGGLIVQWGHGYQGDVYFPIAFNLLIPRILTQHEGIDFYQTKPSNVSLTRFTLTVVGDGTAKDADWYAVGV